MLRGKTKLSIPVITGNLFCRAREIFFRRGFYTLILCYKLASLFYPGLSHVVRA